MCHGDYSQQNCCSNQIISKPNLLSWNTKIPGLLFNESFSSTGFSTARNDRNCVFSSLSWGTDEKLKPTPDPVDCLLILFLLSCFRLPHSAVPRNKDVRRSRHLRGSDSGCSRLCEGDRPVSHSYRESHRSWYESSFHFHLCVYYSLETAPEWRLYMLKK